MKETKESYFEDCNRYIVSYFIMSITNNHPGVTMTLQRNVVIISVRAPHILWVITTATIFRTEVQTEAAKIIRSSVST